MSLVLRVHANVRPRLETLSSPEAVDKLSVRKIQECKKMKIKCGGEEGSFTLLEKIDALRPGSFRLLCGLAWSGGKRHAV